MTGLTSDQWMQSQSQEHVLILQKVADGAEQVRNKVLASRGEATACRHMPSGRRKRMPESLCRDSNKAAGRGTQPRPKRCTCAVCLA
jgi:hypothetical protein